MKNPAAQSLAALAKGKPKRFSKAELQRRRKRMQALNAKRRK
jgi:hypothetical protein